jgi:hypothetical protein
MSLGELHVILHRARAKNAPHDRSPAEATGAGGVEDRR